ncbi:UDP-GlcNAc:betaGal beta-1,3-N-acetylglucosaminyltransferase 9 [Callorhinchus milii]|uniref:Hexosyltransferase n=1 Tax=Callorhinchus milii TaxID=7868 RepID=A0A4W3HXW1_CALMI|nr:UDP-GlcNAc:betaGal beta-1,3-N-acetylglucosaminyltransferase 9 [Callorhinchus milii]XP_007902876.1 UDP-GlcNAc:betaGal beta-1,3-N-acetylglucosaminyltransferase 9 [Callorhinchus milii]|eukprot:gi/632972878/ref/XP_007902875.1/ PREDICTED: UDP-GlcNAc:betaGal beta-1,3-N-acetylglucosaminyltransferase 9 [Callorhinchus milii]
MRLRRKGDLICTFLLLTIFCILIYIQRDSDYSLLKQQTRTAETEAETAQPLLSAHVTPKSIFIPTRVAIENICQSQQRSEKGVVQTTIAPTSDTLPSSYRQYLRQKDCREFHQIINQKDKCKKIQGEPILLISIKARVEEFERREVARKTWAREGLVHGFHVRRLFLLGFPTNQSALSLWRHLVEYESQVHQDILLWDFQDTFFNLTLKEIHFLKWVDEFCPEADFIFKGDNDVYVNVDNIADFLVDFSPKKDLFVGDIIYQALPIRRKKSKYFIPEMMYGQGVYPVYAGGGGFLMTGYTAKRLYQASKEVELFPIDDVFLGMCLLRIGLEPVFHKGFRTFGITRPSAAPHLQTFDPCFYKELMVVHSLKVAEIWLMWTLLHDPKLICTHKESINLAFQWQSQAKDNI